MTQILERRHRVILSKVKSKKTLHRKTEQRILLLMLMIPLVSSTVFFVQQNLANAQYAPMKSGFVIQNLRGDITNTWLAWDLVEGRPLQIQIQNNVDISTEKIDAIRRRCCKRPEWLLIRVHKTDPVTSNALTGRLLAHSPDRDEILRASLKYKGSILIDCSIQKLPPHYAVIL